ncbi:MAG TPA: hypothetical protein VLF68_00255 [Candidatus Saccharimonadales bacterium]|nr:hypothetical protein [Candidatus Saccharimonadales bacterium]
MGNPFFRLWERLTQTNISRTLTILVLLVIVAAIPLTVFISQKQQDIRQRASSYGIPTACRHDLDYKWPQAGACDPNKPDCNSIIDGCYDPITLTNVNAGCYDGYNGNWNGNVWGGICNLVEVAENATTPQCTTNADCTNGVCTNGTCVACPAGQTQPFFKCAGTNTCTKLEGCGTSDNSTCSASSVGQSCSMNCPAGQTDPYCDYQPNSAGGYSCNEFHDACGTMSPQCRLENGLCVVIPTCSGCQTLNGNTCVDDNTKCSNGQTCSSGACVCPAGQTNPFFTCQNNTCVANSTACGANAGGCTAAGGTCGVTCSGCQKLSGTTCVDDNTKCSGGKVCQSGTCTCPAGQTNPFFTCQNNTCVANSTACGANAGGCTAAGGTCGTIPTVKLILALALQGIGNYGSNTSATLTRGNLNPKTPTRTAVIEVFDATGRAVATASAGVVFTASPSATFTGNVDMGALASGNYRVKIKTDRYLKKLVTGFQTLTAGQSTPVPQTLLTVGDVNGDNVLNILDYNIMADCFDSNHTISDAGGKFNSAACQSHAEKAFADLNDDGIIDGVDYNFFESNLSAGNGD